MYRGLFYAVLMVMAAFYDGAASGFVSCACSGRYLSVRSAGFRQDYLKKPFEVEKPVVGCHFQKGVIRYHR